MTMNNTIEGIHLFQMKDDLVCKPNSKKYYWHIPKVLRESKIEEGTTVRGNRKQFILVTKVFRENLRETGKKYASIRECVEFKEMPIIESIKYFV